MKPNNTGEIIIGGVLFVVLLIGCVSIIFLGGRFVLTKYQEYTNREIRTVTSCLFGFKDTLIYNPSSGTYEEAVENGKKACEEQKAREEARKKLHDEYCALIHPNYKSFEEYEQCHNNR